MQIDEQISVACVPVSERLIICTVTSAQASRSLPGLD